MLLHELYGVKNLTKEVDVKNPTESILKVMDRLGFKPIGGGEYSFVFQQKSRPDLVFKLYNDPCYDHFIDYCKSHSNNPFLPKFKSQPTTINVGNYLIKMIRMEKLNRCSRRDIRYVFDLVYCIKDGMSWSEAADHINGVNYSRNPPGIKPKPEDNVLYSTLNDLINNNKCYFDLHDDNVMVRDNQHIVLIDPYALQNNDYSGVYGWASNAWPSSPKPV